MVQTVATEGASRESRCQSASGVWRGASRGVERLTRVSEGRFGGASFDECASGALERRLGGVIRLLGAVVDRKNVLVNLADRGVVDGSFDEGV